MRNPVWLVVALSLLLSACVPASESERVTVEEFSGSVSYYPKETGAIWQYLPSGARLDEARVTQRIGGPIVLDGEVWIAWQMVGRGLDVTWFRQYRPDGVYLRRELRPGTEITFDPPLREFPSEGELRVGATWSGQTTAKLFYPEADSANQRADLLVEYVFTVVDQREVTVAAGTFEVFVINFVTRTTDDEGTIIEEFTQETWFAPFLGEVRTENGFFLVASNVLSAAAEQ